MPTYWTGWAVLLIKLLYSPSSIKLFTAIKKGLENASERVIGW